MGSEISSAWTAMVPATSAINGPSSVSCKIKGSLVFTVFLSQAVIPQTKGTADIPANSVAGRMVGTFDVELSTPTMRMTGNGGAGWILGGIYDPATETISIAIRSSGAEAKGLHTPLGDAEDDGAPIAQPFSTAFNWGWQPPVSSWGAVMPWIDDASTILDLIKAPTVPVIPSEREVDLAVILSLPQTGLKEFQHLSIDLKNPEPQSITQTFEDEAGLGTRTTTWTLALIPSFNIERDDRGSDGRHSFVSTDSIGLRLAIPGVTVPESDWAMLATWRVKGMGPFSGSGVPDQMPDSMTFAFNPSPGARPTAGSTVRNRPLQYTVSAAFEGIEHFFILVQDDVDLLRQEYIDHGETVIPSRGDCVAHPVDGSFNAGNYDLIIDGGMRAAFDKVGLEFGKESRGTLRVVSGFRSPQRNKASGDSHPGNPHVYGRALDLAPDPTSADALNALYQACVRAGYHTVCEATPGNAVPPGSADAKHVHVYW